MPGALNSGGGFSFGTLANRPAANVGISLYFATDNGNLYWTDGAAWHQSGANDIPIIMASGNYYFPMSQGASAPLGQPAGQLRTFPVGIPHDLTLARVGGEVTAIGDAGSTVRLAVYADNGNGYPGALLLDAGTIAGDSATVQEIVTNLAVPAGVIWLAASTQGAPVTTPTIRGTAAGSMPVAIGQATIPAANALWGGYSAAGQAGAAPNPYPAGATPTTAVARLFIKVA